MSRQAHIFVDTSEPLEEFVTLLGELIGASFEVSDESFGQHPPVYRAKLPGLYVEVGPHNYETDRDLRFEEYPVDVAIFAVGGGAPIEGRRDEVFGRELFESLARLGGHRLLLVDDLQVKWGEYEDGRDAPHPPR